MYLYLFFPDTSTVIIVLGFHFVDYIFCFTWVFVFYIRSFVLETHADTDRLMDWVCSQVIIGFGKIVFVYLYALTFCFATR